MSKRVVISDTVVVVGQSNSEPYNWAAEVADRLRFQRRIKETGRILEPVLLKKLLEFTNGRVRHENNKKTLAVGVADM